MKNKIYRLIKKYIPEPNLDKHQRFPLPEHLQSVLESVDNYLTIFDDINKTLNNHEVVIKGKTILEFGMGTQFPHGGILAALCLIRGGARQAFGIDITHPCAFCRDQAKTEFWRALFRKIGRNKIGFQSGEKDAAYFVSEKVLWNDRAFNRLNFLQMSVSDMYFKDDMFDLILSNAVMEHVPDPLKTLEELHRVVIPGGYVYSSWNPFTSFRMGGHDIGIAYYFPWAHLRLKEKEHISKLREVYSDPELYNQMPVEHRVTKEIARQYAEHPEKIYRSSLNDLNQIRINEFCRMVKEVGFEMVYDRRWIYDEDREYLTPEIRSELSQYTEEELLLVNQIILLKNRSENYIVTGLSTDNSK